MAEQPTLPAQPQPPQFDFSKSQAIPVNFCHLRHTNEEFIVDMGLAGEDPSSNKRAIKCSAVLSPFAAKRLSMGLARIVADWEHKFGTIEIEVTGRVVDREPAPMQHGAPQPVRPEPILTSPPVTPIDPIDPEILG